MATFINTEGKEVSEASVLSAYFRKPGQTMSEFYAEVKTLTPADKTELAIGAASALGFTQVPATQSVESSTGVQSTPVS